MAYVRHRDRQVRQSVFEDLRRVLVATGWLADPPIALLGGIPLQLLDYFPEQAMAAGDRPKPNTLAMDLGTPGELYDWELGGLQARDYTFNLAMWPHTDAAALALFNDLADRYEGSSESPFIPLYNYLEDPPSLVVDLEVDSWEYTKAAEPPAPGMRMFYAQLVVRDYLE